MSNPFAKATKRQAKLRMGLMGPSNSGKTWMALTTANAIGKTAVIDTESGSASKYADKFQFDTLSLTDHHPDKYIAAIEAAEQAGYDVVVIDSLTHAWDATKALVDAEVIRTKGNSFQIWGKMGQHYNSLMKRIVASKIHVIATMRSKTEYVIEENDRGKKVPRKIGTAPQVREGAEYEFDVVLELDHEHHVWTVKSRCSDLDGKTWTKPGREIADSLMGWLSDGAPVPIADPPTIAGSNPDIARPVNAVWTDEQKTEAGAIRAEIEKYPGGTDRFNKLWNLSKKNAPTDVIDSLSVLLRELEDIANQSSEEATAK
jgi:hypothetical protein